MRGGIVAQWLDNLWDIVATKRDGFAEVAIAKVLCVDYAIVDMLAWRQRNLLNSGTKRMTEGVRNLAGALPNAALVVERHPAMSANLRIVLVI